MIIGILFRYISNIIILYFIAFLDGFKVICPLADINLIFLDMFMTIIFFFLINFDFSNFFQLPYLSIYL